MTRDTPYATEIGTVAIADPSGHESRLERLFVKDRGTEEIRFSWWTNGRMQMRPLDLPEDELVKLVADGIAKGVLSADFLDKVRRNVPEQQHAGSPGSTLHLVELDRVQLLEEALGDDGERVPAGTIGTVVAAWGNGTTYEVEFTEPVAALATVQADALALYRRR